MGPLAGLLEDLLGSLGALPSWGPLAVSGVLFGRLEDLLGPSWALLNASWAILGGWSLYGFALQRRDLLDNAGWATTNE